MRFWLSISRNSSELMHCGNVVNKLCLRSSLDGYFMFSLSLWNGKGVTNIVCEWGKSHIIFMKNSSLSKTLETGSHPLSFFDVINIAMYVHAFYTYAGLILGLEWWWQQIVQVMRHGEHSYTNIMTLGAVVKKNTVYLCESQFDFSRLFYDFTINFQNDLRLWNYWVIISNLFFHPDG